MRYWWRRFCGHEGEKRRADRMWATRWEDGAPMPSRGGEYARCAGDSCLTLPRLPVLSRLTQGAVHHQHSNESDAANFAVVDRTA